MRAIRHPDASVRLAYLGLGAATVCWACAFIAGKVALADMTPRAVAAWRYAIATVVLLPFALRARPRPALRPFAAPLAIMLVAGGVLYPWLFVLALSETTATNTALLVTLNPALTLLLGPLVGEPLIAGRLAGIAISFTGAATVITRGDPRVLLTVGAAPGDVIAVVAAGVWAIFNLAARSVVPHLRPAQMNALIFSLGGIVLFALAGPEAPLVQLTRASPGALAGVGAMALCSSVLAGQLYLHGLRTVGVGRSVVFVYLVPVLTAALAAVTLGEAIVPAQAIGGAAVLAGVLVATRTPALSRARPTSPAPSPAPS